MIPVIPCPFCLRNKPQWWEWGSEMQPLHLPAPVHPRLFIKCPRSNALQLGAKQTKCCVLLHKPMSNLHNWGNADVMLSISFGYVACCRGCRELCGSLASIFSTSSAMIPLLRFFFVLQFSHHLIPNVCTASHYSSICFLAVVHKSCGLLLALLQ